METSEEHGYDCKVNSYESIERYFRPIASSLRFKLNWDSRRGIDSNPLVGLRHHVLFKVAGRSSKLTFKGVIDEGVL